MTATIDKRTLYKWILETLEKHPSIDSKILLGHLYDDFNLDEVSLGEVEIVNGALALTLRGYDITDKPKEVLMYVDKKGMEVKLKICKKK